MDFGLQLAGLPAPTLLDAARDADQQGYSAVYVPDHFANEPPGSGKLDETILMEATTILGAIAAVTKRLRVGGHVLCNLFRHPALTAQAMTTLDQISGGRAVLGIGAGWTRNEFAMTGIDFPEIGPRLERLDEAVGVIKSLWTQGRTTFEGRHYRLHDAFIAAKPVQKPHPPVLFGGSGKGLLRIAARHGDIVNVIVDIGRAGTVLPSEMAKLTEANFKKKLDFVRDEAARHGRRIQLSTTIFVLVVTDNAAQAQQVADGMGAGFGIPGAETRRMPLALIGTAEECAEELKRREREWGVEHMIMSAAGGLAGLERFTREVLPKARS